MGIYDLPAVVDYILNVTGDQKLYYIGHSMGTTMFYTFLSERPQYNGKIRAMFSLAPIAFCSHMANPVRAFVHTRGLEALYVRHQYSN
jgi:lysosomal acid lipase/cholesteryl ester hydrolase